jgi:predicted amidohydrolase
MAVKSAEIADGSGKFLAELIIYSKANKKHIVTGFNESENRLLYNSAILIGPEGIVGKYRKLHLFMNEKKYFQPGNLGLPVFEVLGIKMGMLVCFDWMFPEVWRIMAMQGAQLICHPSNLVLPYAQKAVTTHAINNRIFIATANRIGTEGDLTFTGQS